MNESEIKEHQETIGKERKKSELNLFSIYLIYRNLRKLH